MRRLCLQSVAALLFVGATAAAQARPNFNGTWAIVPDSGVQQQAMGRGFGDMGGLGESAKIVQNEKTLTVSRMTANMGEFTTTFNLDGTETYASVSVQGQPIPLTHKVRWEGNKLITSTWANVGQTIEIILNLSLDDKGNLVSEHTFPDLGNGMGGGTFVTKYKKTP